jgi:hypothetical protein
MCLPAFRGPPAPSYGLVSGRAVWRGVVELGEPAGTNGSGWIDIGGREWNNPSWSDRPRHSSPCTGRIGSSRFGRYGKSHIDTAWRRDRRGGGSRSSTACPPESRVRGWIGAARFSAPSWLVRPDRHQRPLFPAGCGSANRPVCSLVAKIALGRSFCGSTGHPRRRHGGSRRLPGVGVLFWVWFQPGFRGQPLLGLPLNLGGGRGVATQRPPL